MHSVTFYFLPGRWNLTYTFAIALAYGKVRTSVGYTVPSLAMTRKQQRGGVISRALYAAHRFLRRSKGSEVGLADRKGSSVNNRWIGW
jgi:hypothetical protein